jgi:MSHA biogenesis protein MshO
MSAVPARTQQGFSMVEIVVAIVIMSIIAIGLVDFIANSATGYVQASARNQVSSAGRVVIDRLVMELHNALPESVRISNPRTTTNADFYAGDQCLEFIPVLAASNYIDPAIRPDARKTTFKVVEFVPEQDGVSGVYVVVYPTSEADLYGASFGADTTEAIAGASVADADDMDGIGGTSGPDGINEITTTSTGTGHRFKRASSVDRIYLTGQPISYCITGSKLYRYSNYGFHENQPIPVRPAGTCAAVLPVTCLPATTPKRVLVTDQIDNSKLTSGANPGDEDGQAFDQVAASRRRNAVVQLEFNFREGSQEVRLNHEVLQQATP